LPVVATGVKHVGKEGNDLEEHRAGVVDEAERQLEYGDSFLDDLARVLADMGTADVARQTGYDRSMVRRLKRGVCRPSAERLSGVLAVAARHARATLARRPLPTPEVDADAIGFCAAVLR
jgi:hypothetical protein